MAVKAKKLRIKKGDTVEIISGKDKGKRGKVLVTFPKTGRIIVEDVNMNTKHQKARGVGQQGGIIHVEGAIDASKAMLVCKKCNQATRVGYKIMDDGDKFRFCKKCGEIFND